MNSTSFKLQAKRIEEQSEMIRKLQQALAQSTSMCEVLRIQADEAKAREATWKIAVDEAREEAKQWRNNSCNVGADVHERVANAIRVADKMQRHPKHTLGAYKRHCIIHDLIAQAGPDGVRFAMLKYRAQLESKSMKKYLESAFNVRYFQTGLHMMVAFA